jgi:hypothetical protein
MLISQLSKLSCHPPHSVLGCLSISIVPPGRFANSLKKLLTIFQLINKYYSCALRNSVHGASPNLGDVLEWYLTTKQGVCSMQRCPGSFQRFAGEVNQWHTLSLPVWRIAASAMHGCA